MVIISTSGCVRIRSGYFDPTDLIEMASTLVPTSFAISEGSRFGILPIFALGLITNSHRMLTTVAVLPGSK